MNKSLNHTGYQKDLNRKEHTMTKNHSVSMKDAVEKIIEDGTPETVKKS